ncbi:MAG TPA: enoyl-CoA hydratase-related protein [Candidatus Dormibacteraeota bacterium]|nr:enoyl-CoA hydratase-related protein [Candidatus Dormibacteraeota bacterium]
MQLTEHVSYELRDRIARVRLTRPEARNALSNEIADGLVMAVEEIRRDRRVRAVLLTGDGPIFCAGGDLKAFAGGGGFSADRGEVVHDGLLGLHQSPAPVIAAIQGGAIGYGLGLACACDIRLAAEGTRFQAGFTGIGLSPDSTTSYFLPRLLGPSIATRMMLTNLPVEAEEMVRHGFVASIHPPGQLGAAAEELAQRLSRMPGGAVRRAKELLQASLGHGAEEQVAMEVGFILESFATDDFREGVTAFIEKRRPEFAEERQ